MVLCFWNKASLNDQKLIKVCSMWMCCWLLCHFFSHICNMTGRKWDKVQNWTLSMYQRWISIFLCYFCWNNTTNHYFDGSTQFVCICCWLLHHFFSHPLHSQGKRKKRTTRQTRTRKTTTKKVSFNLAMLFLFK